MTRQEAIKYIKSRCIGSTEERDGTQWSEAMWTAIEALSAERPTGMWKQVDLLADRLCSVCGYGVWDSEAEEYNYCPNCGADMRKGGDTE